MKFLPDLLFRGASVALLFEFVPMYGLVVSDLFGRIADALTLVQSGI